MGVINLGILIRKLSHVFLRKDEAATELSTLGFVKNTDYASTGVGGVIKTSNAYATQVDATGGGAGLLYARSLTAEQYENAAMQSFIGKGTLENAKLDLTARALVGIASAQFAEPTAGTYTVKLTYDGAAWGVTIVKDT